MTSDKLMKEVLDKMPDEAASIPKLTRLLDRSEGSLRRTLNSMLALGLVEKERIDEPGTKYRNRTIGWRKTRRI